MKLAALRKCIERLDDYAGDVNSPDLSAEVDSHRQQFSRFVANISVSIFLFGFVINSFDFRFVHIWDVLLKIPF